MNRLYIAFAMINWDEATKMYYLDYDPLDDRTAVETIINNCLQKNQNEPNKDMDLLQTRLLQGYSQKAPRIAKTQLTTNVIT